MVANKRDLVLKSKIPSRIPSGTCLGILRLWRVRKGTARQEIANELPEKDRMFRKYRRHSLFLLVPLVVPILAIIQWRS